MAEIKPVTVQATGDDQQWKRDVDRAIAELVRADAEKQSQIDYLKGLVP